PSPPYIDVRRRAPTARDACARFGRDPGAPASTLTAPASERDVFVRGARAAEVIVIAATR
ncbi:MAG: hypothetical protein ACJ8AE_08965, partial [Gemmatimonadaceae bacterium]